MNDLIAQIVARCAVLTAGQLFDDPAGGAALPVAVYGHALPMDATPAQYRAMVEQIRDDPHHRGALVTTHKMNVYAAASDLFDELDPFAVSCAEISSISQRGDRLIGRAKDPLTVDLALNDFLPADHFADTGAEVVILGAGGSGTALSWALAERADAPSRITVTARKDADLETLREVHRQHGTPVSAAPPVGHVQMKIKTNWASTIAISDERSMPAIGGITRRIGAVNGRVT